MTRFACLVSLLVACSKDPTPAASAEAAPRDRETTLARATVDIAEVRALLAKDDLEAIESRGCNADRYHLDEADPKLAAELHDVCDYEVNVGWITHAEHRAAKAKASKDVSQLFDACQHNKVSFAIGELGRAHRYDAKAKAAVERVLVLCPDMRAQVQQDIDFASK